MRIIADKFRIYLDRDTTFLVYTFMHVPLVHYVVDQISIVQWNLN